MAKVLLSHKLVSVVSVSRDESQKRKEDTTGCQEMVNRSPLPSLTYTFITANDLSVQLQTALILKSFGTKRRACRMTCPSYSNTEIDTPANHTHR